MATRMNQILDQLDDAQIEHRTARNLFLLALVGDGVAVAIVGSIVTAGILVHGEIFVSLLLVVPLLGFLCAAVTYESWMKLEKARKGLRHAKRLHRDALDEVR